MSWSSTFLYLTSKLSKNSTNRGYLALTLPLSMTRRALKVTTFFSMLSEVAVRLPYGLVKGFDIRMPSKLYIMFGQAPTRKHWKCPVHRVLPVPQEQYLLPATEQRESFS